MTTEVSNAVQREFIKWGFVVVVALLGSGFMSLANRDVYSKEQVDEKVAEQATARSYELRIINTKLDNLSDDIAEVKDEVKKQ